MKIEFKDGIAYEVIERVVGVSSWTPDGEIIEPRVVIRYVPRLDISESDSKPDEVNG